MGGAEIDAKGWWTAAQRCPSPHRSTRAEALAGQGGAQLSAGVEPGDAEAVAGAAQPSAAAGRGDAAVGQGPWALVIHCASLPEGEYGTGLVPQLFLGTLDAGADPRLADLEGVRVSAHLWIDRQGECQQFVSFDEVAWHAGVSGWAGREGLNACSLGIELEGRPGDSFTDAQYQSLVGVSRLLLERYPDLVPGRILGHGDIAPDRKDDPGPGFDWKRYLDALREG